MVSKRLISLTRFSNLDFISTTFFGWLSGVMTILQAWFIASIVNNVFLHSYTRDQLIRPITILLVIMVSKALFVFFSEYSASKLSIRVRQLLRTQLLDKIARLGPSFTRSERTGELALTALDGIESIDAYFSQYLPQVVLSATIPLTVLFLIFPIDLLTGIVFLFTAPLIPLFMYMIGKYGETLTQKQYASLSIISAHFYDILQGITTLKIFGRANYQIKNINEMSEQYRQITMKVLRITFLSSLALELLTTISTAIVAVEIGFRLIYGKMEFLPAFFILILAPEFYFPLRQLGLKYHSGMSGVSAAARVWQILDQTDSSNPIITFGSQPENIPAYQAIRFDQVGFEYSERQGFRLESLDLTIESGKMTAFVGKTGAGKSSLVNLLLRFSQPTTGKILLDSTPLENIAAETWRSQIAWVPQNAYLFFDTIKNNLLVANPIATDNEIETACRLTGIYNFITGLPNGFDTVIGDRGSRLSGGQAQRIALARAFLKNAPLVILDEPTANLDPTLEVDLIRSIEELVKNKTVIVIAHRLKTILAANKIVFMEAGKAIEIGDHFDLMKFNGKYAEFIHQVTGQEVI